MSLLLGIFLLLVCVASQAIAHEDPRGDVRPLITVKDGTFVVTATDNINSTDTNTRKVQFVVDRQGTVLGKERKDSEPSPFGPSYSFMESLPEIQNGLERKIGDDWLIIPEYLRKHGGRPYIIKSTQGVFTYHALGWNHADVSEVVDAIISSGNMYLLVTRFSEKRKTELWLHRFSTVSYKEEASILLPKPCLIWAFPVCSNLILQDGMVHVAVVEIHFPGYDLALASWDGISPSCRVRVITHKVDWNTSVALANIHEDALVAFHYPGDDASMIRRICPTKAEIKTIHIKLEKP